MRIKAENLIIAIAFLIGLIGGFLVVAPWLRLGELRFSSPAPNQTAPPPTTAPFPSSPPFPPSPSKFIYRMLSELPVGQVYHNLPDKMQVGVEDVIEAGIAPKITQEIQKAIAGRGKIHIRNGVRFDPSGVDMKLIVNPKEFEVFEREGGIQFVSAETPGKWKWDVTPIKSGEHEITLKATVLLKPPGHDDYRPIPVVVFNEKRTVDVNWMYSTEQFVSTNWDKVIPLIVGSGSLGGLIAWLIGKKQQDKTKAEERETPQLLVKTDAENKN